MIVTVLPRTVSRPSYKNPSNSTRTGPFEQRYVGSGLSDFSGVGYLPRRREPVRYGGTDHQHEVQQGTGLADERGVYNAQTRANLKYW